MLKFAQKFSRPGKSLENGDKVWKERSLESFYKEKNGNDFFPFGKIFAARHEKTFLRFSRSILITYLITSSLEKKFIVLEKNSGKSLQF